MRGITNPEIPERTRISTVSGYSQDTVLLNEYGFTQRNRTNKKGVTTQRHTIQVSAEPLIQNFSALELGKAPAAALALMVQEQIGKVSVEAKPMTVKARLSAMHAIDGTGDIEPSLSYKEWVSARYSGGKIGLVKPTYSTQLFNDSGRLKMVTLRANRAYTTDAVWEINVPKNRLDPSTWSGNLASFTAMVNRLQKEVPVLGNNRSAILGDKGFVDAVAAATESIFAANDQRIAGLKSQLAKAQFGFAYQVFKAEFRAVLGAAKPF